MDQLIGLLHDGRIFKYYRYREGASNQLVVSIDQQKLLFLIRQTSPMHDESPRVFSVTIALEVPKKKKAQLSFPHDLKRHWLALKLYEESLITYQGPQPPIVGDLLLEPHMLLRLVSIETPLFHELLLDEVPQSLEATHGALSDPPGMPERVQLYRVLASSHMEVLSAIYFMVDIVRHRLFDTPIAPLDVQSRIEQYAEHTGGSLEAYLRFDQDSIFTNNNFGQLEGEEVPSMTLQPKRPPEGPLPCEGLPNLYRVTEQDSYIGEFNDPLRAYMVLDRQLVGAPEQLYFERSPTIFDEDDDDPEPDPDPPMPTEAKPEPKTYSSSEVPLIRPVPRNRPHWAPVSSFSLPVGVGVGGVGVGSGPSPLFGLTTNPHYLLPQTLPELDSWPPRGIYNAFPDNSRSIERLGLQAGLQKAISDVLTKDLKFQHFREESELDAVKVRFAVRLLERNINFVVCGDPDAIRIYTSLENLDLRYPLQVRRETVHRLVLELNQHITIGAFQLEERPLAPPTVELVMTIHYCVLTPEAALLRGLLKRLFSLSMATMKDIGIKLLEQVARRPHNNSNAEAIDQSITQAISERHAARRAPPQQEEQDLLTKFLQRFGSLVNMEDLRPDADPEKRLRVITPEPADEGGEPTVLAGGFSKSQFVRFQGRPAVVKTMNTAKHLTMLLAEYRVMRKLSFRGIPALYGLFYSHESQNVCMIMENVQKHYALDKRYCVWPCSLHNFMAAGVGAADCLWPKVFCFLEEFLFVLQNVHRADIAHCDLSASNIIVRDEPERLRVFLIDFGSAVDVEDLRVELSNPRMVMPQVARKLAFKSKGTLGFASPEVRLEQFPKTEPDHAKKTDIYSLGLLLYYLLFQRKLSDRAEEAHFSMYSEPAVLAAVRQDFLKLRDAQKDERAQGYVDLLAEFMTQTLRQSASLRPTSFALWAWLKEREEQLPRREAPLFAA